MPCVPAADSNPQKIADAWQVYRAAEADLYSSELEAASRYLTDLRELDLPPGLRLSDQWLEATLLYQQYAYAEGLEILLPLAEEAAEMSFFELAVCSTKVGTPRRGMLLKDGAR